MTGHKTPRDKPCVFIVDTTHLAKYEGWEIVFGGLVVPVTSEIKSFRDRKFGILVGRAFNDVTVNWVGRCKTIRGGR